MTGATPGRPATTCAFGPSIPSPGFVTADVERGYRSEAQHRLDDGAVGHQAGSCQVGFEFAFGSAHRQHWLLAFRHLDETLLRSRKLIFQTS